jgi:hypothetical protein
MSAPVPAYIEERIRRPYPSGCSVVEGSTPVVCFGDARTARVATLGLNPSDAEFLDRGGWLQDADRRFETLASLGLERLQDADDEQTQAVLDACHAYFYRNPYWRWFGKLEAVLNESLAASYRDGSAVHLDLVQWATRPVWSKIGDPAARRRLVEQDREFLRRQLALEHIGLVLMNGRTVMVQVAAMGVPLQRHCELPGGPKDEMLIGTSQGTMFLGWNKVFPAGGISAQQRERIVAEIRDVSQSMAPGPASR